MEKRFGHGYVLRALNRYHRSVEEVVMMLFISNLHFIS